MTEETRYLDVISDCQKRWVFCPGSKSETSTKHCHIGCHCFTEETLFWILCTVAIPEGRRDRGTKRDS